MENIQPLPSNPDVRHEDTGFSARGVAWFSVGLVGTVVLVSVVTGLTFALLVRTYAAREHVRPADLQYRAVPSPRLEVDPPRDLHALRSREDAVLNTYGWVDQREGVAHIPIARAMELLVKQNLLVRQSPAQQTVQPEGKTTPLVPPPPGSPLSEEGR